MPDDIVAAAADASAAVADKGAAAVTADAGAVAGAADKGAAAAAGTIAAGADPGAVAGADKGVAAAADKVTAPADWPDNWRDKIAEQVKPGDKAFRQRLERFAAPSEITKSWLALEQKQSAGELKPVLPENATPEQVVAWRADNGIPESWEKYEAPKLADGLVLSEADKPVIDLFTQFAHAKNMKQGERDEILSWYYTTQDALVSQREDADAEFRKTAEDQLRATWGADYRANLNAIGNFLSQMPGDLWSQILGGRTHDGKIIGNDPRWNTWLAQVAREFDPAATLVTPAGGAPGATLESRLEEIRTYRKANPDQYDADKKMQAEELELLEIKRKRGNRSKAA